MFLNSMLKLREYYFLRLKAACKAQVEEESKRDDSDLTINTAKVGK